MSERVVELLEARHEYTVFKTLGIEVNKVDAHETILCLNIDDRHRQHVGLVHGGIFVLLAESAASIAAASSLSAQISSVVAIEINANHVRSVKEGRLIAKTEQLHAGKKSAVYQVRICDDRKNLLSIARCTLMYLKSELGVS